MEKMKQELPDDLNPQYMFDLTSTALLIDIVKGRLDPYLMAKEQLANRGCDDKGQWIGFSKAEKYWREYRPRVRKKPKIPR